jgi:hypothetical protein
MERIDRAGGHSYMSPDEIEKWYKVLEEEHATYLAKYGVSFPARDTVKALWLVFLRKYKGKLVHKDTISSFVNTVNPNAGKDQQVRHLAADGWFILNKGDRIPDGDGTVPSGYHVLVTTVTEASWSACCKEFWRVEGGIRFSLCHLRLTRGTSQFLGAG